MAYLVKMKAAPSKNFLYKKSKNFPQGVLLDGDNVSKLLQLKKTFLSYKDFTKNFIKNENSHKALGISLAYDAGKNNQIEQDILALFIFCAKWYSLSAFESLSMTDISFYASKLICSCEEDEILHETLSKDMVEKLRNYFLLYIHLPFSILGTFSEKELLFLDKLKESFGITVVFGDYEAEVLIKSLSFSFSFFPASCDIPLIFRKLDDYMIENKIVHS